MSFKFAHTKIDTRSSGVPTLAEWYKMAQTKKALAASNGQVKTASTVAPVQKEAKIPDFIQEKIDAKKNKGKKVDDSEEEEKDCEKPMKPSKKKASVVVAEEKGDKEEGESSGQPEFEGKVTNDPNKDPKLKEGKGGGSSKEKDEGESSGQLDVEPLHQKGESTGEKPGSLDTQKTKKGEKSEKKESKVKSEKFVRVAELTPKQKDFVRKTWSLYWPKSFIDALLA